MQTHVNLTVIADLDKNYDTASKRRSVKTILTYLCLLFANSTTYWARLREIREPETSDLIWIPEMIVVEYLHITGKRTVTRFNAHDVFNLLVFDWYTKCPSQKYYALLDGFPRTENTWR